MACGARLWPHRERMRDAMLKAPDIWAAVSAAVAARRWHELSAVCRDESLVDRVRSAIERLTPKQQQVRATFAMRIVQHRSFAGADVDFGRYARLQLL